MTSRRFSKEDPLVLSTVDRAGDTIRVLWNYFNNKLVGEVVGSEGRNVSSYLEVLSPRPVVSILDALALKHNRAYFYLALSSAGTTNKSHVEIKIKLAGGGGCCGKEAETLGNYVYRWDDRRLSSLSQGFQPRNPTGTLTVITHVKNAYDDGTLSKQDSQWVSTMDYRAVKKIDAIFAQKLLDTNLYKIDVNLAQPTGNFVNANQAFRDQGLESPYKGQAEFAKLGGIPRNAIVGSLTGKEFYEQTDKNMPPIAPNENELQFTSCPM